MEYRRLGATDIELSVIGLGTWPMGGTWWGKSDDQESINTIRTAVDLGINHIDTAEDYGEGRAEEVVGKALVGNYRRKVIIATKVLKTLKAEQVRKALEDALERLKTDCVDIFYIHEPDPKVPIEEIMGEMMRQQKTGKIRVIGLSNFSIQQMREALEVGRFEIVQPPYSLLWRVSEEDILPFCIENNTAIASYSSIAQGLLSGKLKEDTIFEGGDERPNTPLFQKENYRKALAVAEQLKPIAKSLGVTLPILALKWVIEQPGITSSLVGARTVSEIKEDSKAADCELSPDVTAEITRISNRFAERLPRYKSIWEI